MKGQEEETPPSSVNGDDEIYDPSLEGEEFIYIGDADEVLGDGEEMDGMLDYEDEEETIREPPRDDAALVFSRHTGSVFCCDLHPDGKIAATGGEDDMAFVWEVDTGRVLFQSSGHTDSVIFVGFSFDGAYLATADMSGVIKVWRCTLGDESPSWPVVWEYEAGDLTWGLWHYGARVLLCGAQSGEIYVFKIPTGDTKVLQGHSSKVECAKMFPDGRRLAAGYEDGTARVWDLKSQAVTQQLQCDAHGTGVAALDTHHDNNLVVTVSSDGKVVLTTASTGKVVGQIDTDGELETVAFTKEPELGYFALGTLDGKVSIWDASRQMVRHECCATSDADAAGVTKLLWSGARLLTACLDGSVRAYDGRTGARTRVLTGHSSELLDMCYHAARGLILTTSDDRTARVFHFDVNKEE